MGNLGLPEILLIALFILIFFGARKIPDIAQGLGKGIREFRKASRDLQEDVSKGVEAPAQNAAAIPAASTCYFCGAPIAKDARFCQSCGKSLAKPECPKCHTLNKVGAKFCNSCGEKLA